MTSGRGRGASTGARGHVRTRSTSSPVHLTAQYFLIKVDCVGAAFATPAKRSCFPAGGIWGARGRAVPADHFVSAVWRFATDGLGPSRWIQTGAHRAPAGNIGEKRPVRGVMVRGQRWLPKVALLVPWPALREASWARFPGAISALSQPAHR